MKSYHAKYNTVFQLYTLRNLQACSHISGEGKDSRTAEYFRVKGRVLRLGLPDGSVQALSSLMFHVSKSKFRGSKTYRTHPARKGRPDACRDSLNCNLPWPSGHTAAKGPCTIAKLCYFCNFTIETGSERVSGLGRVTELISR